MNNARLGRNESVFIYPLLYSRCVAVYPFAVLWHSYGLNRHESLLRAGLGSRAPMTNSHNSNISSFDNTARSSFSFSLRKQSLNSRWSTENKVLSLFFISLPRRADSSTHDYGGLGGDVRGGDRRKSRRRNLVATTRL